MTIDKNVSKSARVQVWRGIGWCCVCVLSAVILNGHGGSQEGAQVVWHKTWSYSHYCSLLLVFMFSFCWSPWSNNICKSSLNFYLHCFSTAHAVRLHVHKSSDLCPYSRKRQYSDGGVSMANQSEYSAVIPAFQQHEAVCTVDFWTLAPLQNFGTVMFFKPSFLQHCSGSESPLVAPWTTRTFWMQVYTSKECS